jgi:hypothetical protein
MLHFKYDVEYKSRHHRSKYDAEQNLVHEFNASNHTNACLTYDTSQEARNAAQAMVVYVRKTRTPVVVIQRGKNVFFLRKEGE